MGKKDHCMEHPEQPAIAHRIKKKVHSTPHGFDNLFYIERYYNSSPPLGRHQHPAIYGINTWPSRVSLVVRRARC
jgi:hypothetical protein